MDAGAPGVDATGLKICTGCRRNKPLCDYYRGGRRNSDGMLGIQSRCKGCTKIANYTLCECGRVKSSRRAELCQNCRTLVKRQPPRVSYKNGYRWLSGMHDHPNARRGKIAEHVVVMSEVIGRPLLPHENVHHKNGVRDDNDPKNLELWSTSQPSGQRVEDKLDWCRKFLAQYASVAV